MNKSDTRKDPKSPASSERKSTPSKFKGSAVMPSQQITKISPKEFIEEVKGAIPGWDKEMADLLALPKEIYRQSESGEVSYSESKSFGMGGAFNGLGAEEGGRPASDYGIYFTETSHNSFFSFVDLHRGIMVRVSIVSIDRDPPETSWKVVKDIIKSALALAQEESKKGPAERRVVLVFGGTQPSLIGPF